MAKIESLHPAIGSSLYRGILKLIAKVWNPADIQNTELERQVLAEMEQAEKLRRRFESVLQQVGEQPFQLALRGIGMRSFHQIDSVELLEKLVQEMERGASF